MSRLENIAVIHDKRFAKQCCDKKDAFSKCFPKMI